VDVEISDARGLSDRAIGLPKVVTPCR